MLLAPLVGTAMVVAVATEPLNNAGEAARLTMQEKMAATEPLVRSATDCIIDAVIADPRYGNGQSAQLGDLIVELDADVR